MKFRTVVVLARSLLAMISLLSSLLSSCADSGQNALVVDINNPMASDENDGTIMNPLRTIQEAADRATPGMTIYVREGTYNEMVTITKSGTADAMIVFKSFDNEHVIINSPSYACFELRKVEYIEIKGFELTGAHDPNDNMAHDAAIKCKPLSEDIGEYGANHCIFSNNIVYDNEAGIWLQLSNYNIVKNNICYNNLETPIRSPRSIGNEIFNNLTYNNSSGEPWGGITYYGAPYTKIYHNTVVENIGGAIRNYVGTANLGGAQPGTPNFVIPCSNCEIYDNIGVMYGEGAPLIIASTGLPDRDPILDQLYGPLNNQYIYNLWYHVGDTLKIVSWGDLGEDHVLLSLAEFQEKGGEGYGDNSIVADPLFVNSENNDYRLQVNSPAKGAASDGTDLGVNFDELPSQQIE